MFVYPGDNFIGRQRFTRNVFPDVSEAILFLRVDVGELVNNFTVDKDKVGHAFGCINVFRPNHVFLVKVRFKVFFFLDFVAIFTGRRFVTVAWFDENREVNVTFFEFREFTAEKMLGLYDKKFIIKMAVVGVEFIGFRIGSGHGRVQLVDNGIFGV
jgi:hypothetical protein